MPSQKTIQKVVTLDIEGFLPFSLKNFYLTLALCLLSLFIMREAGIKFARKRWAAYLFSGLMFIAMITEYSLELSGLQLKKEAM